jgi:signal transduction histidine kinase
MPQRPATGVEDERLQGLLQQLVAGLGLAPSSVQLWVDDDLGLHPRAVLGAAAGDTERRLVRQCCLHATPLQEGPVRVLPLALSDRRSGALLLDLAAPEPPGLEARLADWIAAQLARLDLLLGDDRLARLSGVARRADTLRGALAAAHALEQAGDLGAAFAALHRELRPLVGVDNFFVILLDEPREWLHYAYYVDEFEQSWEPLRFREGRLQGALSAFVVASGRLLRGPSQDLLAEAGHADTADNDRFGPNAADWLGVPLPIGDASGGAMVVQSYRPGFRFDDSVPGVLSMVAEAAGAALHRRRVREALERQVAERTAALADSHCALEASLARLRATQAELVEAEKHAALGRLVRGVAHEINTPLGVCITGASHLDGLRRELEASLAGNRLRRSELEGYLQAGREVGALLLGNLRRLGDLVERFRQLATALEDEPPVELALGDWLRTLHGDWQPRFAARGHHLELDIEAAAARQVLRPAVLREVLGELLDNALQHAAVPGRPLRVQLRLHRQDDGLHLEVADDGVGLPSGSEAQVFDPFFTTARSRGQVGLGLHRAQILVSRVLGGHLAAARSGPGGSRFVLRLQRRPAGSAPAP